MPRNAVGVYQLPASSVNPPVSGATIVSADYQAEQVDIASELTNSVDRLGRSAMLANLPMGGFGVVGVTGGLTPIAGQASENVTYNVLSSAPAGMSNGVIANMAFISLTAGRWLVAANCITAPGAGVSTSYFSFGASTTSGSFFGGPAGAYSQMQINLPADKVACLNIAAGQIVASTSPFTVYFVAQVNFSGGAATMGVFGTGGAIRLL